MSGVVIRNTRCCLLLAVFLSLSSAVVLADYSGSDLDVLLLHFDQAAPGTDSSSSSHTITISGAAVDTSNKKFGTASLYFDGVNDYVSIPDSEDWNFGSYDFTIDFWFRPVSAYAVYPLVSQVADANNKWELYIGDGSYIQFKVISGGVTSVNAYGSHGMSASSFYHIALVRDTSKIYIFVNGLLKVSADISQAIPDISAPLIVGGSLPMRAFVASNIDELRIVKGTAVWTSTFTPPNCYYYSTASGCNTGGETEPSETCGDGVVDTGEECDDNNTVSGDNCSSTCEIEETVTTVDADDDGFNSDIDCDDTDYYVNPDNIENSIAECSDGKDNDCDQSSDFPDGLVDCVDPDCSGITTEDGSICCQVASDCPTGPCVDGSPTCSNNKCDYTGVLRHICDDKNCAAGKYCTGESITCVDADDDKDVCNICITDVPAAWNDIAGGEDNDLFSGEGTTGHKYCCGDDTGEYFSMTGGKGCCEAQNLCADADGNCVESANEGDDYCSFGDYTSRTQLIALTLLNLKGYKDFTLYCDDYKSVLNNYKYTVSTINHEEEGCRNDPNDPDMPGGRISLGWEQDDIDNVYFENGLMRGDRPECVTNCTDSAGNPIPCVNNFCVLEYWDDASTKHVVFGTSLNQDINSKNYPFKDILGIDKCIMDESLLESNNGFSRCLASEASEESDNRVWYNPKYDIVIFSNDGIDELRAPRFIDAFNHFFSNLISSIVSFFKGESTRPMDSDFSFVKNVKKFQKLYLAEIADKSVSALLEGDIDYMTDEGEIITGEQVMFVNYTGFNPDFDICDSLNSYYPFREDPTAHYNCVSDQDKYALSVARSSPIMPLWQNLTSALRVQVNTEPVAPDRTEVGWEYCNGIDDDGDGEVDEAYQLIDNSGLDCGGADPQCIDGDWECICMPHYEMCNGIDDDCDGEVDEGCDDDADGYWDYEMQCPEGESFIDGRGFNVMCGEGSSDCNDEDSEINAGATEVCDDIDNDCSSGVDNGCDTDGDGYCDANMYIFGVPEVCPNENDVAAIQAAAATTAAKAASSSKSVSSIVSAYSGGSDSLSCVVAASCSGTKVLGLSAQANAHAELPDNSNYDYSVCCESDDAGLDTSCSSSAEVLLTLSSETNAHAGQSGFLDDVCLSADSGDLSCGVITSGTCEDAGYDTCIVALSSAENAHLGDCNSGYSTKVCCSLGGTSGTTNPGQGENSNEDNSDLEYWRTGSDCEDDINAINPEGTETCNGKDDDCDGTIDDGVGSTYYRDADGDGDGDSSVTINACSLPSGYSANDDDCNDNDDSIYTGASETCNGVDDDCDGKIDDGSSICGSGKVCQGGVCGTTLYKCPGPLPPLDSYGNCCSCISTCNGQTQSGSTCLYYESSGRNAGCHVKDTISCSPVFVPS